MDWKQLERDREAGTRGPWGEFDGNVVPKGKDTDWAICALYNDTTTEDARRITRVPDLEALALAGRELAEAADCTDYIKKALEDGAISDEWAWIFVDIIKEHDAALAAWRKAGGGENDQRT